MGSSRVQVNKKHKTRFQSNRNAHKVSSAKDKFKMSKRDVAKGAKAARLQRNKMIMEQKREAVLKEKRALSGSTSPPRVIMLFGLSSSVNINSLEEDILAVLSAEGNGAVFPAVASPKYRMRATVLKAPHGDLLTCLEMAKVADLIAFVASPNSLHEENDASHFIDSFGSQCLSAFRILGLPSTTVLIRDLPTDVKRRQELKKMCISSLASEFPDKCNFHPAGDKDELQKFMLLFKEQRLTIPDWRNQRSYVLGQKVDVVANEGSLGKCTLVLTGYVRVCGLSVNQLVHVTGAGDFQMSKIELLKDPCTLNLKSRKRGDVMDSEIENGEVLGSLTPDPMKQEHLAVENVPDPLAGEQTYPTKAEIDEAVNKHEEKMKKKRNMSEYQAAWIVDDSDAEYSNTDEDEDDMMLDDGEMGPNEILSNGFELDEDQGSLNLRDSDDETETNSVMMDCDNLTKEQIEEQIRKIKEAHADDEEFPDEVDTPLDIPARKRFAKYRGVKSFRTSSWDPKESLPPEYGRIFAFDNFSRTKKHVFAKALDMEQDLDGTAPVGSYVRLYIDEVPEGVASKISTKKTTPIIASGLLQHESKVSVLHFSIKKHDTYTAPIKAKEELLFHVGFRQFVSRPIFSSDSINANLHKMERFLHPGRFSVASVYAPICFPHLPLIAFKSLGEDTPPVIAAGGSLKSVDPDRIILKKIILTGYPQRVSKLKATVRYMFHNPEDVRWFKPVEVWTKLGRRGRIKEPVGTHGVMKCILNGSLQQNDTLCMSLFKRAYPKWPQQWFPLQET